MRAADKRSVVQKCSWSVEEDAILTKMVETHGPKKWSLIAQSLDGRVGKQCRERWHNHLSPDVRKDAWTPEEDALIFELVDKLGTKWASISKHLDGRTDNSIKNRYYCSLKKLHDLKKAGAEKPNAPTPKQSPAPSPKRSKPMTPEQPKMESKRKRTSVGSVQSVAETVRSSKMDVCLDDSSSPCSVTSVADSISEHSDTPASPKADDHLAPLELPPPTVRSAPAPKHKKTTMIVIRKPRPVRSGRARSQSADVVKSPKKPIPAQGLPSPTTHAEKMLADLRADLSDAIDRSISFEDLDKPAEDSVLGHLEPFVMPSPRMHSRPSFIATSCLIDAFDALPAPALEIAEVPTNAHHHFPLQPLSLLCEYQSLLHI